jgi:hypothetical protein
MRSNNNLNNNPKYRNNRKIRRNLRQNNYGNLFYSNRINRFVPNNRNHNNRNIRNVRNNMRQSNNMFISKNNPYNINRFNNNNNLTKQIKELTRLVKTTSLTGGPLRSLNMDNKRHINDPNNKITKEIRYDKLYSAFDMYTMGKYYSFFKTTNMILRLAIYSTYNLTFNANLTAGFIWYPYAYPNIPYGTKVSTNKNADTYCDFYWGETGSTLNVTSSNLSNIPGMYRLIAASLKLSNITTNSLKGGSYTIFRTTRNEGQPCMYLYSDDFGADDGVMQVNAELLTGLYENEPVKYLYNANQIAMCNEFGVIQGNTIFQGSNEYMGSKNYNTYSAKSSPVGGSIDNFNPDGVNVKYIGRFDATTTQQSYKVQVVKVFEVTPLSTESIAATTFKGSKSVNSNVIEQAKNYFNLQVINP